METSIGQDTPLSPPAHFTPDIFLDILRTPFNADLTECSLSDLEQMCDALKDARERRPFDCIAEQVESAFHLAPHILKTKNKTERVAAARLMALYLCRKLTDKSTPVIGRHFGRDHSMVFHAVKKVEQRMLVPGFRVFVSQLQQRIARELKV